MAPKEITEKTATQISDHIGDRKEILFDGYYYDVTNFISTHPGGSIIKYYTHAGEDATHAIQQFHHRSKKRVKIMMNSFKKRPASDNEIGLDATVLKKNRLLTEDFTKLYLELESEGLFNPSYTHIFLRFAELFLMWFAGYGLLQFENYVVKFIGIVLIGLMQGRCGWVQHEGGHRSLSGNSRHDRLLQAATIGLGMGLSSRWWTSQHNRHHAMPQRLHHDVDLETLPLLAYNTKIVNNSKHGAGFMIRNQVYLFTLIDTLLVMILWTFYLHPRFVIKHKCYLEMLLMSAHYLQLYLLGFWPWIISKWIMGIYSLTNFTLNHTFLPVTTEPTHWVEYSLLHTADVEDTTWCNWWMGYLNYQIEHHLFPTMPQYRHPLIKDRVRSLAEKHNIPYVVHRYPEALRKVFKNLSDVAKDLKHL